MSVDSDFLLAVKEHVTAKLKSLGAFIDEELPDYIMVMVANKKSEQSMAKDLQLFLGEHTLEFTRWLHQKLTDLRGDGYKSRSKERDSTHVWKKPKSEKRKLSSNQLADSSQSPKASRSRSRSPISPLKPEQCITHSREPHGDVEQFNIHPDENEFLSENVSSATTVRETRKVVSTSSLLCRPGNDQDEAEIDSTQQNSGIRSVVKVKQIHARGRPRVDRNSGKSIEPPGRLLQQAVKEARESIQPPDSSHSSVSNKPVACSDVSSTANVGGKTKFFVTLSGMTEKRSSGSVTADSSVDSFHVADGRRVTKLRNIHGVKSRLGDRRIMPYARSTAKLSARARLGPISQCDAFEQTASNFSDDDLRYELLDTPDNVELIEGAVDDDDLSRPDADDDFHSEDGHRNVVPISTSSVSLVDRLNKRHLVVSLNEAEEDEDVAPLASEKLARVMKDVHVPSPSKGAGNQGHIPSNLERCRYWPNCKNGDECQYIHPSEPCPTFPRCRLGSTCTYIHPPCRFGAFCARDDCAFAHTTKRVVPRSPSIPSVSVSQVVCRFQHRCTRPLCPYYHPPSIPRALPFSRPIIAPIQPLTVSPVPCRFGSACTNRPNCPFAHPDTPRPEQLKWVAASKQSSVTTDTTPATTSTATAGIARQAATKLTASNAIGLAVSSR